MAVTSVILVRHRCITAHLLLFAQFCELIPTVGSVQCLVETTHRVDQAPERSLLGHRPAIVAVFSTVDGCLFVRHVGYPSPFPPGSIGSIVSATSVTRSHALSVLPFDLLTPTLAIASDDIFIATAHPAVSSEGS